MTKVNKIIENIKYSIGLFVIYFFKLIGFLLLIMFIGGFVPNVLGFVTTMFFSPVGILIVAFILYRIIKKEKRKKGKL